MARAFSAAGFEDAVDLRRVGQQPAHFLGHGLQLGHGQIGQRILEAGELLAGELGDHRIAALVRQRGIDVEQVFRFRPVLQFILAGGQGQGIGLGAADLVGDGVGIVGQIDAANNRFHPTWTFSWCRRASSSPASRGR